MPEFEAIKNYLSGRTEERDGIFYYLPKISDFLSEEIAFHDLVSHEEVERHQLNSLRNKYYHDYFKKYLRRLPPGSIILEVGAGVGYDARLLLEKGYRLIVSDVSGKSVDSIKSEFNKNYPQFAGQIIYLVSDGQNLPLPDKAVEAVFMVATFHHFPKPQPILSEVRRVVKAGGLMILAMEPSRFMMWFTGLFKNSKKLRLSAGSSIADDTHPGFSKTDWINLTKQQSTSAKGRSASGGNNKQQSTINKIKRVWLLCGFVHYGLEAAFRLLNLKKRIKLPRLVEVFLVIMDEILLKIPIVNRLNWHWIVVLRNNE